ncbi:Acg family FMN-binding oxidoreductase [Poseidonibacter lekithochrous]|uniref:Acg family FMN-binding oxidoreductase n=1 Tax=Poseidonibacter lekithochrous TaxID=1904463 RepID=UPI00196A7BAD|nr:hypothetical protein [Poseidonibacter lekithochrous]
MNKQRRDFIKVIGLTTGIILAPSLANASKENYFQDNYCDSNILNKSWEGHNKGEQDIRIKVLSYGILAANPHNTQAWLIDLKEDQSIDLYVDKTRVLPQTDPFYRQIHIAQGTFLENLSISASYFGYKAQIDYFPNGEYSNETLEEKAIANIKLIKDNSIKKDKLFDFILLRHTNKRKYQNLKIDEKRIAILKNELSKVLDNDSSLKITSDKKKIQKLSEIVIEAMRIENQDKQRDLETIKMFRFNDSEVNQYRDGFGFAQNGKSGITKFLLENFFVSREDAQKNPHTFANEGLKITKDQALSTNTYAWLSTKGNSRLEQVKIGRVYAKLNLITTSLGLAIHPMSQVLQEYKDMNKQQAEFLKETNTKENHTVQMFFRIGNAEKTEHTARRDIKDFYKVV